MRWSISAEALPLHVLIYDRDFKFPASFNYVFEADAVKISRTPFRSPTPNAFAERWVRAAREECRDHVLILNERHLQRDLKAYAALFNHARPHQGIGQQILEGDKPSGSDGPVRCRNVRGGA